MQGSSWSRALIQVLVELCQVEGEPKTPPWLAPRGKTFKTWTSRCSKNAFLKSLVLLTGLNQIWKCVAFVKLHSSSPRFINNVYKIRYYNLFYENVKAFWAVKMEQVCV